MEVNNGWKGSGRVPVYCVIPVLKKVTKRLTQNSWRAGRDSNAETPEFRSGQTGAKLAGQSCDHCRPERLADEPDCREGKPELQRGLQAVATAV
jgi:hypothetical protein